MRTLMLSAPWGWVSICQVLEQCLAWQTPSKLQPKLLLQASHTRSSWCTVNEWHELAQLGSNSKCQFGKAGNNQPSSPYGEAEKKFTGVSTEQVPILMPVPTGSHLLSHLIPTTTTDSSLSVKDWTVCVYCSPVFADKTFEWVIKCRTVKSYSNTTG